MSDAVLTSSEGRGRSASETNVGTPEISDSGASLAWQPPQVVNWELNITPSNGALGSRAAETGNTSSALSERNSGLCSPNSSS